MHICVCTLPGLVEGTRYEFFVTAENGVSSAMDSTQEPILVSSEFLVDNSTLIIAVVVALVVGIGLAAILFVIFLVVIL